MSRKKKKMMTPAEVAQQLAAYISKQEETLKRYPVGPLANSAKMNLAKGKKALSALQQQNETMRVGKQAPQGKQMNLGGSPSGAGLGSFGMTGAQQAMVDTLSSEYGMSPAIAAAVAAVTQKESSGSGTREEMDYSNTSNERIRTLNSRFKRKFGDMSDEDLNALKADPEKFFNFVYDDVAGNSAEGDGYKYRGRGLVQVTGKENYRRVSQAVYGDDRLVENPDLLLDDKVAGAAAAYFTAESGKGVEGYVDFDLSTPNPTPEQIQEVLNGTYAVVASGGTLPKSVAQDSAKMAERYGQFDRAMPVMQQFAQNAVPTAQNTQGNTAQTTPQATGLLDTPDFMLTPEAQAEKAASTAAEAAPPTPEAQARLEDVRDADFGGLDFEGARAFGAMKTSGDFAYAENEFGDFNVVHPEKGKYVVRRADWNPYDIDNSLTNGIRYSDEIDGPATTGDIINTMVSPVSDPTGFETHLKHQADDFARAAFGENTVSGMDLSFDDVAELVAEQRGVKPVRKIRKRIGGEMGKPIYANVSDPADLARYEREMQAIYGEIAANPGTFEYTTEQRVPLSYDDDEYVAKWESEGWKIEDTFAGKIAVKDMKTVGVGGYSPMSDYVAYNTNDPDYQNRYQNRQQTHGLIGNMLFPGSMGPLRGAAVGRGAQALGQNLGDDVIRAVQSGDDALIASAVNAEARALGTGQKVLGQGTGVGGPAVKGVPGMKFKPGTQGGTTTYTPANNAAGRTIDITPVRTTRTGPLTAREQIRQSGVNVLDDGAGGVLGVQRGQFRFPAGSAGGKGGQFGGVQPGGLSLPGSRLPAVRNVGLQTRNVGLQTTRGAQTTALGRPGVSALQRGTIGLADDAMGAIPTIERAQGIGGSIFTRIPFALERTGLVGAATYFPQFDERIFPDGQGPVPDTTEITDGVLEDGIDPVDPVVGGDDEKAGGVEETPAEVPGVPQTPTKDFEMGAPDQINIDMGNPSAMMAIPALASLGSVGIQRRALNAMEGPARPDALRVGNFDYRSNVGQQLLDARESTRAMKSNTNLQGTQQAALSQSLNTQRLQQEARIRQQDELMRQQALNRYENMANQVRNTNNAMLNQYKQDSVNFDNAMVQAQAAVKQQPLQVMSGVAQDYLKNIYQTNMANTLEGIGRQFNTNAVAGGQGNQGAVPGAVPIFDAQGNITGYRQQ